MTAATAYEISASHYKEDESGKTVSFWIELSANEIVEYELLIDATPHNLEEVLAGLGIKLTSGWNVTPYLKSAFCTWNPKAGA
jgi:hypothetical protein